MEKQSKICLQGKNPDKLSSEEIVNIELHQAKKEIDSFVKDKNAPIIFAGDFNISRLRDLEITTNF